MLGATNGTLSYNAVPNSGKLCHLFSVQRVSSLKHKGSIVETGIYYVFTQKWKTLQLFKILFFLAFIISFINDVRLARNCRNMVFHLPTFEWNVRQSPVIVTIQLLQIIQGVFTVHVLWNMIFYKFILTRFTVINIYHRNNDCELEKLRLSCLS
jgi:hypothetical protein